MHNFINSLKPNNKNIFINNNTFKSGHLDTTFWEYLSKIWSFLQDSDRKFFEAFWDGLNAATFSMEYDADTFAMSIDPEYSYVNLFDYYHEFKVGPLYSKPTNLYPTINTNTYEMRPVEVKLVTPDVIDDEVVRRDMIRISRDDYHAIRNIGIGQYLVVDESKFFRVLNLFSSEESKDTKESARYSNYMPGFGEIQIENKTSTDSPYYKFLFEEDTSIPDGTISIGVYSLSVDGIDGARIKIGKNTSVKTLAEKMDAELSIFKVTVVGDDTMKAPNDGSGLQFPFDRINFSDMKYYTPSEIGNGRYVKPSSVRFKCYDSSIINGTCVNGDMTTGEYVDNEDSFEYYIQIDGSLIEYEDAAFRFYITTGLSYSISENVIKMHTLTTTPSENVSYTNNSEYIYYDNTLDFSYNIFDDDNVSTDGTMYSRGALVVNDSLFSLYGGLVGISDWRKFSYDNTSAKSAISGLMLSLQTSMNIEDYNRALNIYYGVPVSPDNSKTCGLFESYGYEVTNVLDNFVTIRFKNDLSQFMQIGTTIVTEKGYSSKIIGMDRITGVIELEDAGDISDNNQIYTGLQNKCKLIEVHKETSTENAYIVAQFDTNSKPIQHVVDIFEKKYTDVYPELVVYDSEYAGVYRYTKCEDLSGAQSGMVKITLYKGNSYNDNIVSDDVSLRAGHVHIQWPTHKFLLMWQTYNNDFYSAYFDSPIDTKYYFGEDIPKYTVLGRNVSALKGEAYAGWSEYGSFRSFNSMDEISSVVEVTSSMDGVEFGSYFPVSVVN